MHSLVWFFVLCMYIHSHTYRPLSLKLDRCFLGESPWVLKLPSLPFPEPLTSSNSLFPYIKNAFLVLVLLAEIYLLIAPILDFSPVSFSFVTIKCFLILCPSLRPSILEPLHQPRVVLPGFSESFCYETKDLAWYSECPLFGIQQSWFRALDFPLQQPSGLWTKQKVREIPYALGKRAASLPVFSW